MEYVKAPRWRGPIEAFLLVRREVGVVRPVYVVSQQLYQRRDTKEGMGWDRGPVRRSDGSFNIASMLFGQR